MTYLSLSLSLSLFLSFFFSLSTLPPPAAGEHASYARPPPPDDSATPDATPTETGGESSVLPDTDTGSEFSGGFNEMIGSLHSLRRGRDDREEDDDQSTTITETSSVDEREGITGGVSATEGPNIRQRK